MNIELSVIVPIYNEEEILYQMAEQLAVHLDKIIGKNRWQYVLVDNGSYDSTPKIIEQIVHYWPNTLQVRLNYPNIGRAQAVGLELAEGQWAYIIQTDWWDPVFLRWAWANRYRYSLIFGSKRADPALNRHAKYRRVLSWGLNTTLQFFFGFVGTDTHGDKLLHLPSMRPILKECVMHRGQYDTELVLRAMRKGLWLAEVPIPIEERRNHRNWMIKKIAQNIWDIFWLWRALKRAPYLHSIRYHRWAREDMESVKENHVDNPHTAS